MKMRYNKSIKAVNYKGGLIMSEEYGNDYITLVDEDGKEIELEHLDTVEYKDNTYMAFLPANMDLADSYELIIMKVTEENGLVM